MLKNKNNIKIINSFFRCQAKNFQSTLVSYSTCLSSRTLHINGATNRRHVELSELKGPSNYLTTLCQRLTLSMALNEIGPSLDNENVGFSKGSAGRPFQTMIRYDTIRRTIPFERLAILLRIKASRFKSHPRSRAALRVIMLPFSTPAPSTVGCPTFARLISSHAPGCIF